MSDESTRMYPEGSFDQHNGVLHLMIEYSGAEPQASVFGNLIAHVLEDTIQMQSDNPKIHLAVSNGTDTQDFDLTDAEQMIAQSKALLSTIRQNFWQLQDVLNRQNTLARKIAWLRKKVRSQQSKKFNDVDIRTYRTMVELRGKAGADNFYRERGMEIPPMEILVQVHEVTDDGIK